MQSYFRQQAAGLLELSPSKLDVRQPLNNLGLDSLMAIQLKNRIEVDLAIAISVVQFLQGCSIAQLVTEVLDQMPQETSIPTTAPACMDTQRHDRQSAGHEAVTQRITQEDARKHLAELDRLSDAEVNALLLDLLADEGSL